MKYFLGFLAAVALIVVVFVLILRGFSGSRAPATQINLLDFAKTDTYVQMTVDGPVVADAVHKSYRIIVGRDQTSVAVMKGYEGEVTDLKTYDNNEKAYAAFLRSLQLVGFTKGDTDPAKADERGYCSEANRYVFEIVKDGKKVQHLWTTDCGGGTYDGGRSKTETLFVHQIPDYRKVLAPFGKG